ncbi:hypothetical protein DSECCO2_206580 [anaerobic digester metagenome]
MSGNEPDLKLCSFVADYRDNENNYYHSVHQIGCVGEYTDNQVVSALKGFLENKGYVVIYIVEIFGQYDIAGLRRIVDNPMNTDFLNAQPRYMNVEEARKAAV